MMLSLIVPTNASARASCWSLRFGQSRPGVSSSSRYGVMRDGRAVDSVRERGFADVRHADDHHPHGLFNALRGHFGHRVGAGLFNARDDILCLAANAVKAHAVDPLRAEIPQPRAGFAFIGQIGLAEHEQMALVFDHIGQIRVSAGAGNPRVAKLHDHIDAAELIGQCALGSGHVAGIPVDLLLVSAEHHIFVHCVLLHGAPPHTPAGNPFPAPFLRFAPVQCFLARI